MQQCPRDHLPLERIALDHVLVPHRPVWQCAGCGGAFLERLIQVELLGANFRVDSLGTTPLRCPQCGEGLLLSKRDAMHLHACQRCEGLWFDSHQLGFALAKAPQHFCCSDCGELAELASAQEGELGPLCTKCAAPHGFDKIQNELALTYRGSAVKVEHRMVGTYLGRVVATPPLPGPMEVSFFTLKWWQRLLRFGRRRYKLGKPLQRRVDVRLEERHEAQLERFMCQRGARALLSSLLSLGRFSLRLEAHSFALELRSSETTGQQRLLFEQSARRLLAVYHRFLEVDAIVRRQQVLALASAEQEQRQAS